MPDDTVEPSSKNDNPPRKSGRGRVAYTHEKIAEEFRKQGCELLSRYTRGDMPLEYRCRCGEMATRTWYDFRAGKGGCQKCCKKFRGVPTGQRHSRTHLAWMNMLQRCYNPKSVKYATYGERGIQVCQRWRDSFAAFLEDMGESPPKMTLDRKDNDGNYEPGNCRWATMKEQQRNRKNNRWIEAFGYRRTMAEWSELNGIPTCQIWSRITYGWSPERAVSVPLRKW